MYTFFHNLLSDRKGGEIFTLFSFWHFFYIALAVFVTVFFLFYLRRKHDTVQKNTVRVFGDSLFMLYILDFFLMPLAYGEIDIEKLPFHACTATCVACFFSRRLGFLKKFKGALVLLALISNLVYLIYPAGVMWHEVHPLCYRVIQTLLFHSLMTSWAVLTIVYENELFNIKKCHLDLTAIITLTMWALLGNYVYNGQSDGYSHFFNWFFVVRDPFYAIPEEIAPFVMPFINVGLFFCADILLHLAILLIDKFKNSKARITINE